MRVVFVRLTLLSACLAASALNAADKADKMPKNFVGGSSEAVKGWTSRSFDALKGAPGSLPGLYCVYIVDETRKNNSHAFHLESKEFLGSAEAKEALSKFTKLKIKADPKTEGKGWPETLITEAESGGTVMLVCGDVNKVFDKHTAVAELTPAALAAAANFVKAHHDGLAKASIEHEKLLEKETAAKELAAKEKAKEASKDVPKDLAAIPGLDPKKEDPKLKTKPDPKAKPDPKTAAAKQDPKPGDKKPADAGPAKKKSPEDE